MELQPREQNSPAQRKYKEAKRAFVGINVIPTNKNEAFSNLEIPATAIVYKL